MTTVPSPSHIDLSISRMTCAACVRRIETALKRVDGVRDATVNLVSRQARVTMDGTATDVAALIEAVHAAGYAAEELLPGSVVPPRDTESARVRRHMLIALTFTMMGVPLTQIESI